MTDFEQNASTISTPLLYEKQFKLCNMQALNPLNPTFPHLKALRPEIPSQKFSKKIIFFFFSFWDYESPAALKPTSKSV